MRQGSMIHICEPEFTRDLEIALEEAYIAHTTTSPNNHILASLDLARMQAEMEGFDRLKRAVQIAAYIRKELQTEHVRALSLEDLTTLKLLENNEVYLDPLKITLFFQNISANSARNLFAFVDFGFMISTPSNSSSFS